MSACVRLCVYIYTFVPACVHLLCGCMCVHACVCVCVCVCFAQSTTFEPVLMYTLCVSCLLD